MDKIIVEVGSTCTKVDKFNGKTIEKLEGKTKDFFIVYDNVKKGVIKLEELMIDDLIKVQLVMKTTQEKLQYFCKIQDYSIQINL